ncbi:hypothetical protein ACQFX9_16870 [Aliinostoc sp. HNIBRCY26]|uniref:hypothetical protein n=1 Tax=Aliinostoc sp. HNIBRCY26 TaxID=3418997 RepID=UPI003CFF14E2
MRFYRVWQNFTGLTVGFVLFSSLLSTPVWAGRYIFNQKPQTLHRYFGHPTNKQTQGDRITYTYQPKNLRWLLPQFPRSDFSITFINNQAKTVTLNFNGNFDEYSGSYNYDQYLATKFYQYLFGYQPPIWHELTAKFSGNETIYFYEYCLGDGVATSFERYGYKQFTDTATLTYDTRCETPYNF